jgi:hypothetical protein
MPCHASAARGHTGAIKKTWPACCCRAPAGEAGSQAGGGGWEARLRPAGLHEVQVVLDALERRRGPERPVGDVGPLVRLGDHGHDLPGPAVPPGHAPGQELPQDDAEGVDVGAEGVPAAAQDLGRQPARVGGRHAGQHRALLHHARQVEVADLAAARAPGPGSAPAGFPWRPAWRARRARHAARPLPPPRGCSQAGGDRLPARRHSITRRLGRRHWRHTGGPRREARAPCGPAGGAPRARTFTRQCLSTSRLGDLRSRWMTGGSDVCR